jgi:hypothetical protein
MMGGIGPMRRAVDEVVVGRLPCELPCRHANDPAESSSRHLAPGRGGWVLLKRRGIECSHTPDDLGLVAVWSSERVKAAGASVGSHLSHLLGNASTGPRGSHRLVQAVVVLPQESARMLR